MARVEHSLDVRASVEAVFAAITDPRRAMEWNHEILEVSDLVPGPIGPGTSWRQPTIMGGRQMNLECRIVSFDPPHEGVLSVSGDQDARIHLLCSPVRAGNRITQNIDFELPGGLLGRMAGGVIGNAVKSQLSETMERQRRTLEEEAQGRDGSGA